MKKVLSISMFFSMSLSAQDIRSTVYTYSDPIATTTDGFNIGFGFDYQRQTSFNSINLFVFPNLRGLNYTELTASHGLNAHFGYFNNHRIYGKMKAGVIMRDSIKYGFVGFESGYEHYFNNGVFIGAYVGYDYRTDAKYWGVPNYWRKNGYLKIGFTL